MKEAMTKYPEIVQHYTKSMGEAKRVFRIDEIDPAAPNPIWILEFAPPSEGFDWVYATIGMSSKPMPGENAEIERIRKPYVELLIYSKQNHEELVELLARLAAYPFVHNTFFSRGHLVAGSGEGVVPQSRLTEILLINPIFDTPEFETIDHADGSRTHILWVVPLYPSERLFAKDHGVLALLRRFAESRTDTSDLFRDSAV